MPVHERMNTRVLQGSIIPVPRLVGVGETSYRVLGKATSVAVLAHRQSPQSGGRICCKRWVSSHLNRGRVNHLDKSDSDIFWLLADVVKDGQLGV